MLPGEGPQPEDAGEGRERLRVPLAVASPDALAGVIVPRGRSVALGMVQALLFALRAMPRNWPCPARIREGGRDTVGPS